MPGVMVLINRALVGPTVMGEPLEVIQVKMEAEVAEDSIRMAGRIS